LTLGDGKVVYFGSEDAAAHILIQGAEDKLSEDQMLIYTALRARRDSEVRE
jgi:hypothetical protein